MDAGALKKKVPDLGNINYPNLFATFMQKKDPEVTTTLISVPTGKAQKVGVPALGLSLIFVTSDLCARSSSK